MCRLQALFDQPILTCVDLDPGLDENHGSLVFCIHTVSEQVVARSFRLNRVDGPFWGNLHQLFAINPLEISEVLPIYTQLKSLSPIPVPSVRYFGRAEDRDWVIVEWMRGNPLGDFAHLSRDGLVELGRSLGIIHSQTFNTLGNPSGSVCFSANDFPQRLAAVFRHSIDHYPDDPRLALWLEEMCAEALTLSPPVGVFVLPDIGPTQFLQEQGQIVALVDVDAYVIGPRELDFICLEYWLDEPSAKAITEGYSQIQPLPDLAPVRRVYRYLSRLLTIRTDIELEEWMAWPELFP